MNESPKVVDASLAVKWLVDEEDSGKALDLRRGWADSGVRLAAPYLMLAEVSNTLHRKVVDGGLALQVATETLEYTMDTLEIEFHDSTDMRARSAAPRWPTESGRGLRLHLPSPSRTARLRAVDRGPKFYRAARRFSDRIRWLGDFAAAP